MSLRVRLSLIVSLLFVTGMLLGLVLLLGNARQRVAEEVEAATVLTSQLLEPLFTDPGIARDQARLLERLRSIDQTRHLDIYIEAAEGQRGPAPQAGNAVGAAPAWFVGLVEPPPQRYTVTLGGQGGERLLIRTNPSDEIDEVWRDTRNFIGVLLLVMLVLIALLHVTIGRWLAPVGAIIAGLDEAEHGNFGRQIPPVSLPELKAIAEKFNQLTAVLRRSKDENDRLTQMALVIRENERQHLSRELHDQLGQSISAIKAIAFSIAQRLRGIDAMSVEGATRIGAISNEISSQVRSMMSRLRPALLDELGLVAALQSMVDEWNLVHRETFCSFRASNDASDALDADARINVYRIVQEALTNVARHAQAERVDVTLTADARRYELVIADNGRGFAPGTTPPGMGLSGIRERCQALNGSLTLVTAPGAGVRIELVFGGGN